LEGASKITDGERKGGGRFLRRERERIDARVEGCVNGRLARDTGVGGFWGAERIGAGLEGEREGFGDGDD
jgi:hypothetical protein